MKMLLFTPKAPTPPVKRRAHVFGCFVSNLLKEVTDVRQEKVPPRTPVPPSGKKHTFYSHRLICDPSKNGILLSKTKIPAT